MKHCLCLGFCIAIMGAAQLHAARDVTSAVTEDYQHDQEEPVSCFRLEMDNAKAFYAESASAANCYTFPGGNSRSEYIPKLLLTCAVWPPRLRCLAYA